MSIFPNTGEIAMQNESSQKEIYIVISQTGSIVSRIIRSVTGAVYNHASISLDPSLDTMYSFGRIHAYNPIWGGYVKESPNYGAFRRFRQAEVMVLAIKVNNAQYEGIKSKLEAMYDERGQYHYNYAGLFLALFHKPYRGKNHYTCSEFVRDVLEQFQVIEKDEFLGIVHPMNFMKLPDQKMVYRGRLSEYEHS
ncbi:MAG: hypothetical protein J1E62_02850 [Lachnospiraceae bacterium]|nr:hypothetical protein [Lachnospiraceae bacterium]